MTTMDAQVKIPQQVGHQLMALGLHMADHPDLPPALDVRLSRGVLEVQVSEKAAPAWLSTLEVTGETSEPVSSLRDPGRVFVSHRCVVYGAVVEVFHLAHPVSA